MFSTQCADIDGPGGHYCHNCTLYDAWTTTYTSDANGDAQINLALQGFSIAGAGLPTRGHAVVVHSGANKVSCGTLMDFMPGMSPTTAPTTAPTAAPTTTPPTPSPTTTTTEINDPVTAVLGAYPDYVAGLTVQGTAQALDDGEGGIWFSARLSGLAQSASGGIHIHAGIDCDTTDGPQGHYCTDCATDDPWTTTYTSDDSGEAMVYYKLPGFSVDGSMLPVTGHAVAGGVWRSPHKKYE